MDSYTRDWDPIPPTDIEHRLLKDAEWIYNDQIIGIFPSRFTTTNSDFRIKWSPPEEGEESIINTPNKIVTENDKISFEIIMESRADDFPVQSSILFIALNDRMRNLRHGTVEHPDSNNSLLFRCNYGFNDEELVPYDQNNLKTHLIKGMTGTKTKLTVQPTFHGPANYRISLIFCPLDPAKRDLSFKVEVITRLFKLVAAVANGV